MQWSQFPDVRLHGRYADYRRDDSKKISIRKTEDTIDNLGVYLKKIPIDHARASLAEILVEIGIHWFVGHEEAHIELGHLDYIRNYFKKLRRMEPAQLGEGPDSAFEQANPEANIIFELQADRLTTRDVVAFFLETNVEKCLPRYAKGDESSKVQLIVTGIGLALILLDRERLRSGESPGYPTVRVRFCSVIQAVVAELALCELKAVYGKHGVDAFIGKLVDYTFAIGRSVYDVSHVRELMRNDREFVGDDPNPLVSSGFGAEVASTIYVLDGFNDYVGGEGIGDLISAMKNALLGKIKDNMRLVEIPCKQFDELVSQAQEILKKQRTLADRSKEYYWPILQQYREARGYWNGRVGENSRENGPR